jgi:hypothetical protein
MNDVEDSVAFCVLFPVFVAVRSTQCREAEDTTFVRPKDECGLDRKGPRAVRHDWHMDAYRSVSYQVELLVFSGPPTRFSCTAKALCSIRSRMRLGHLSIRRALLTWILRLHRKSTPGETTNTTCDQFDGMNLTFSVSARARNSGFPTAPGPWPMASSHPPSPRRRARISPHCDHST